MSIVILEDNADRRDAMMQWLEERLPMYGLIFTDDPDTFIGHVRELGSSVLAASLDHELYDREDASTTLTGMHVVDHLVTMTPTFPVLLHTTNRPDGERMQARLKSGGWSVEWVVPFDGTNWIATDWYRALKRAIRSTAPREKTPVGVPG